MGRAPEKKRVGEKKIGAPAEVFPQILSD